MQHILDIDLDFFVYPVVFGGVTGGKRPDSATYRVEIDPETELASIDIAEGDPVDVAVAYARERLLIDQAGPGWAVRNHGEVFGLWQELIDDDVLHPPFHVTHVDAHGDFSEGETGFRGVFDVLGLPVEQRAKCSRSMLSDGDYLAHAVACQWISELEYVYCPKGGSDIGAWAWENFKQPDWYNHARGTLRLHPLEAATMSVLGLPDGPAPPEYVEPPVSFEAFRQAEYEASTPFDFVFLAWSPEFSPESADVLYGRLGAMIAPDSSDD